MTHAMLLLMHLIRNRDLIALAMAAYTAAQDAERPLRAEEEPEQSSNGRDGGRRV